MRTFDQFTANEQDFIDQFTRRAMVDWCHRAIKNENAEATITLDVNLHMPYVGYAVSKKWLSVKAVGQDGGTTTYRVLSAGWQTAARFLKR